MIRRLAVVLGVAAVVGAAWVLGSRPMVIRVPPGSSVSDAVRAAPAGAVIRLLPGTHDPFEVARPVAVEGDAGAVVRGPVTVTADGVRLADLVVVGGETGIVVRDADDVLMEGVTVHGARLHGIEVAPGSVRIEGCRISGLGSPYAQGFEVRNSNGRPRTVVEGCTVSSGQEGLVAHVSRVEFRDNTVTGTTLRAIVITEMSEGLMEGNVVREVSGIGLYCGDESHCEIRHNLVRGVAPAEGAGPSHAGYGAVALYYATMRLSDNTFQGLAAREPVRLALSSVQTERFPLAIWPPGWRGAVPALWVAGLSLVGLGLVRGAAEPYLRRLRRRQAAGGTATSRLPGVAAAVLAGGLLVQAFHMLEHFVQVYQIHVADAEIRSGLAGARVDTEWVHFTYNTAVLAFLVWAWWLVRSGRAGSWSQIPEVSWLFAALLIQGYHFAEHAAKIVQHLVTGVDPAPGLFGARVGLVWFHFGINVAVFAGAAVPIFAAARAGLRWWLARAGGEGRVGVPLPSVPAAGS